MTNEKNDLTCIDGNADEEIARDFISIFKAFGSKKFTPASTIDPHHSIVQVSFPNTCRSYAYYNDKFDLKIGNFVYVEGAMKDVLGRVTEINHSFKIKPPDYKKVIHLVDTKVQAQFFRCGAHLITFDNAALPPKKALSWFKAPNDEEEYVTGHGNEKYFLNDLNTLGVSPEVAKRGIDYYENNKAVYLNYNSGHVFAIVTGSEPYEVEFDFNRDIEEISALICSCYCACNCKHEVAVLLQFKEILKFVEEHYSIEFDRFKSFSAMYTPTLLNFALGGENETASILFN